MQVYYCDEWSASKKKPWNPFDEPTAYLHHQEKRPYTAILAENDKPEYIVNVAKEWVSVSFLDEQTRQYLSYDFEVKSEGKLFLKSSAYWEYDDETNEEITSLILAFHEDGHIVMEKRDLRTGSVEERETEGSLKENWDVFPEFGHYHHLCRVER